MAKDPSKKWYDVSRDEDDRRVFVGTDNISGIVRKKDKTGKHLTWRSVEALASESGLDAKVVEETLVHYKKKGIVDQNEKGTLWGYWENIKADAGPASGGLVQDDQQEKMNNAKGARTNKP